MAHGERAEDHIFRLAKHECLEWSRKDSLETSRHRTDFDVLQVLGKGGFGRAYKVRNKLDSCIYTLKCILLRDGDASCVLREVQALSSLNSEHIVRYYSAWVEKGNDNPWPMFNRDENDQAGEGERGGIGEDKHKSDWTLTSHSSVAIPPNPTCHLCHSTYKDWQVSFENWGFIDVVLQPYDLCISCYKKSIPSHVGIENTVIIYEKKEFLRDYLFILMEYCESTLVHAIQNRDTNETLIWGYFCQIVQGLSHVHSRGLVHRDIKPSNIFVNHKGVVKIGDLGLATAISSSSGSSSFSNGGPRISVTRQGNNKDDDGDDVDDEEEAINTSAQSSMVGTFLYAAPEIIANRNGGYNKMCNPACDIFSLGVLLVEIFSHFITGMERVQVLMGLRNDHTLPLAWTQAHPIQARLALRMTDPVPAQRPTCAQILVDLIQLGLCQLSGTNDGTLSTLSDLTSQITELLSKLRKQEEETTRLRKLLREHNIKY